MVCICLACCIVPAITVGTVLSFIYSLVNGDKLGRLIKALFKVIVAAITGKKIEDQKEQMPENVQTTPITTCNQTHDQNHPCCTKID